MSGMTPEQRSMRARIAAHSMHAQGKTNTDAADSPRAPLPAGRVGTSPKAVPPCS